MKSLAFLLRHPAYLHCLPCYQKEDLALCGSAWSQRQCLESWLHAGNISQYKPGEFQSTFIKAGDSETRKGLGEEKQQERD